MNNVIFRLAMFQFGNAMAGVARILHSGRKTVYDFCVFGKASASEVYWRIRATSNTAEMQKAYGGFTDKMRAT